MFSRPWRRMLAGLMAGVVLAAQALAASYACPQVGADLAATAVRPCHESPGQAMDPAQPLLCKAHCAGEQSTRDGGVSVPSPLPTACIDALWVRALDVAATSAAAGMLPAPQSAGPPRGAPPLYLSLLALRN